MTMTPYDPDLTRSLKWMQNNAPNIQAIINAKQTWYTKYNAGFWSNWEDNIFNLETANAFGLVVWCIILGLPLDIFVFDPITNAFAYGAQRGNFLDGGGNVAPIQFVGTTLALQSGGVTIPSANWTLNETSDAITFTTPPNQGAALTWTATVKQQNTGQTMIIQQPRRFGTGDGVATVFSLIPSDSANYNQVGSNFYGGGSNVVGLLSEIRYACQLRYIALVSNGRQQWINQMLRYIFNKGAAWNFPAKEYFYLTDNTQASQPVTGASIYRADWQGNQLLYSTPRTNYLANSVGDTNGAWTLGTNAIRVGNTTAPDGTNTATIYEGGPSSPGFQFAQQAENVTLALNTTYTASVWAKLVSGPAPTAGEILTIDDNLSPSHRQGVNFAGSGISTTWQRFSVTFQAQAATTGGNFYIAVDFGQGAQVAVWGAQLESGDLTSYIPTSTGEVTVTDYTLDADTGAVVMAVPPVTGAALTWAGSWQWASTSAPQAFGTGNGSNVDFTLTAPPGAIPPLTANHYMEYRVGAAMGLSAQFLEILNNPAYGIMPQCAGTAYAVVQES